MSFSRRKAATSRMVTPGSERLKLVHSGLWIGIRPRSSTTRSWNLRVSSVGAVMGMAFLFVSSTLERHADVDLLARLRRDEAVGDGGHRHLRVARVRVDIDRIDGHARLPLLQRADDAVLDRLPRGD